MGRSSSHVFSQVPRADIPRSSFNRSHGWKGTFNAGYLVPVFVDEALPGDTFNLKMHHFCRLSTPEFPIMDNVMVESFFFAVPIRLVWDNWQKFNGEQIDPGDSTDFLVPQMTSTAVTGYLANSLHDYMGIPTEVAGLSHSSLWHRAYNLIWNEWFRDQNIQDSLVVDRDDGPDDPADYVLKRINKKHDYFSSALPWPQKGDEVVLPLGDRADVRGIGINNSGGSPSGTTATETTIRYSGETSNVTDTGWNVEGIGSAVGAGEAFLFVKQQDSVSGFPDIYADLSVATAASINTVRQAFQIQRLLERDARGGTRYKEIILAHFGVDNGDARLQRPEFLGGGRSPLNFHPVAQNSATASETPQGNLAAFAVSSGQGGFVKGFTEHCLLIGLIAVRADLNYQQGLNRMWSRRTRYDFYWPALSHLGEQAILNKELFADASSADDEVFGYAERYAEYRYKPSVITGEFRSNFAQSLDAWHLAQDFTAAPALMTDAWIEENAAFDRVIAVPSAPHFLCDAFFNLKCARPMPLYSVPGMIDHW